MEQVKDKFYVKPNILTAMTLSQSDSDVENKSIYYVSGKLPVEYVIYSRYFKNECHFLLTLATTINGHSVMARTKDFV